MSNRRAKESPSESHVDLPLAAIRVDEGGVMRVTYDGREFPHPSPGREWTRAHFGELLDALSAYRTRTVRVEVREHDGSVFTDIIHARRRERVEGAREAMRETRRTRHRPIRQLIEVRGSGFIPGEDITVALSVSNTEGSSDESARAKVDLNQLMQHPTEILLIGRISGVIVSERLPL